VTADPERAVPAARTGASPFFAKPEMGSVRLRVQKIGRRPEKGRGLGDR